MVLYIAAGEGNEEFKVIRLHFISGFMILGIYGPCKVAFCESSPGNSANVQLAAIVVPQHAILHCI